MKRNNKKGFTIVELVIVIAVIAILSAVLIPTFGSVINDAQDAARDQEAKNLYTTYLANVEFDKGETIIEDGYVAVETGTDTYVYYTLTKGNLDLDSTVDKLPAGHYVVVDETVYQVVAGCTKTDCGHTVVTAQ